MMVDNRQLADAFRETLGLRWSPVALRLMRPGEEIPEGIMEPPMPLRHCQSIMVARRGNSLYMPPRKHSCPDGAGILGLVEMAPKLKSGDLYLLFKKLPNIEIAQKMIASRPEFGPNTYTATLLAPLETANFEPDVVIFTIWPEQAMWLSCARTYSSGERQAFRTSGYNSTCADLTVEVIKSSEMNISFGCYGARASSEINDFELYVSIPYGQMESIAQALLKLSRKSIPEERRKIYMPPVMDNLVSSNESNSSQMEVLIDDKRCSGCGLCEAFCPHSVFEMAGKEKEMKALVVSPNKCSACYTCVGQCPQKAIQLRNNDRAN
ncbi:MAG TPA: DUF169 domain-containing protein [Syntrophomonadaceae bacterium]|nr:DUF169 domain-containing protein [Syntrophomonadaceae bacterium]